MAKQAVVRDSRKPVLREYLHVAPGERTIRFGNRGDDVKVMQRFLGVPETGEFELDLRVKLVTWQRNRGLVADGVVDKSTWAAAGFVKMVRFPLSGAEEFGVPEESEFYGKTAKEQAGITRIQRRLGIALSGVYDNSMRVAVMRWQSINRREKTGRVGQSDWSAMF